jgi:phenylpropionate dioxygenase-like ring-hydroxylating dioxygenase large terminal subunit
MTAPAVKLPHAWFIACRSRDLRERPLGIVVQGTPLVLFRGSSGSPAALEDRCPHRNAPLSAGRMSAGELECGYHGWRFDPGGACAAVPGLARRPERAPRVPAFACEERDGYVWTYSTPDAAPRGAPFRFPHLGERGYGAVRRELTVTCSLQAALENALDVPHTAFLHGGLFRTPGSRAEIEVVVRRHRDRCEAEFLGEPRPGGLAARLLAPGGGVVSHVDRFLLPSIAQVEYRIGDASHLVVTTAMTPRDGETIRFFSVATFRLPLPGWLVAPLVTPVAGRILAQDARMLALQAGNVARFGGEHFANTELDVLGPQIARLLEAAERSGAATGPDGAGAPEHEHRVRMRL